MKGRTRVLVMGAAFGGCDRAAEAVAAALLHAGGGRLVVETADFFKRFAPRLAPLAALAHRTDAAFLPDRCARVVDLAHQTPDSPVVRELSAGAIVALENVLDSLEPAAVVCTHPVAAAAAAELRATHDFVAATVSCEIVPRRMWVHPDADLLFVASEEAREHATLQGAVWDRVVLSGVPCREAFLDGRPRARGGTPVRAALVAPGERVSARRPLIEALERGGAEAVDASDGDPGPAVHASDLAVCVGGGEMLWSAPACGVALALVGEPPSAERSSADALVASGAALAVRDAEHLEGVVAYLARHPDRLAAVRAAARAEGRPDAARIVAERVAAAVARSER